MKKEISELKKEIAALQSKVAKMEKSLNNSDSQNERMKNAEHVIASARQAVPNHLITMGEFEKRMGMDSPKGIRILIEYTSDCKHNAYEIHKALNDMGISHYEQLREVGKCFR